MVFAAEALVDFAGFAAGAGFESAGPAAEFEPEEAGADALSDLAAAVDLLLLADFVEAVSFLVGALDSEESPDFAVLLDFDFAALEVLALESVSAEDFESAEPDFAAFDFFALAGFAFASESFDAVESSADAFVDFDFFVLADFVSAAESLAEAESPEASFVDFDFFAAVDLVDPFDDFASASFAAAVEVFDFDAEVFPVEVVSLLSVELASVDFFFFVVFLAVVVLESLESEA